MRLDGKSKEERTINLTDQSSDFSFTSVLPGKYRVEVMHWGLDFFLFFNENPLLGSFFIPLSCFFHYYVSMYVGLRLVSWIFRSCGLLLLVDNWCESLGCWVFVPLSYLFFIINLVAHYLHKWVFYLFPSDISI